MELKINGINFNALNQEQLAAIQTALTKQFGTEVTLVPEKAKVKLGVLEGKLDADGNYTCAHCGSVQNYNSLDEETQAMARKYDVCAKCIESIKISDAIKAIAPKRTIIRSGASAADTAKAYVKQYANFITPAFMKNLNDKVWCAQNMRLHYALFIEKPANISAEDLKVLTSDAKGKRRFGAVEYTFPQIPGKVYLMTNDLYKDKVDKIGEAFETFLKAQQDDTEVKEVKGESKKAAKKKSSKK